jgi:DNA-binding NarL/FixJ family response regulator
LIKILLADDHSLFREGLKQILAHCSDIRVTDEAGNGHDALAKMRTNDYDMVLLDISMPGRSGLDILGEIRREKPSLPILILSMHPEDQYAMRVLKAGAAGYLTKESAADELITAIRKVAGGGKYINITVAEKIASALDASTEKPSHHMLSNREFQVLCMLASGKALKEIADELILSEKTITTYRARILEKLQLKNNVELTRYAMENGLVG